ncbi:MAG: hypothetical protein H0W83_04115 [Planctomycetes bacterium]|nr:hypothetical protein [Planctomycetota bacterium]
MNVYFCDICGVRVTDVDLHSGHGMRRRNDVICATCLDLGHGKDWMQKGQEPALASVGADSSSASASSSGSAASDRGPAMLDVARDRARTVEEDEPGPIKPLEPVVMRVEPPVRLAPGVPDLDDDNATAKVPVLDQNLASTAAGFAALGISADERRTGDDEDLEETPVPQKPDDTGAEPILPAASGVSPFNPASEDADREKEETRIPGTPDTEVAHKGSDNLRKSSDRYPKAGKSGRSKSGSASRVGKPAKSGHRGKPGNQQLVIMSAVGGVLILIIGIILIVNSGSGGKKTPQKIVDDLSNLIRTDVKDARTSAQEAINSHDPVKLRSAQAKLQALNQHVNQFSDAAQKLPGWDEGAVERFLETQIHYQDTKTLLRVVNDELAKQHSK